MSEDPSAAEPRAVDASVPHAPRIWNYWLGGKDNFAADREVGDRMAQMYPDIVELARADRAFLGRAVRYLVLQAGSGSSSTSAPACPPPATPTR